MTVCEIFFKVKFGRYIQNFSTLDVFGKFILIVRSFGKTIFVSNYTAPSNRVKQGTNREILR